MNAVLIECFFLLLQKPAKMFSFCNDGYKNKAFAFTTIISLIIPFSQNTKFFPLVQTSSGVIYRK